MRRKLLDELNHFIIDGMRFSLLALPVPVKHNRWKRVEWDGTGTEGGKGVLEVYTDNLDFCCKSKFG